MVGFAEHRRPGRLVLLLVVVAACARKGEQGAPEPTVEIQRSIAREWLPQLEATVQFEQRRASKPVANAGDEALWSALQEAEHWNKLGFAICVNVKGALSTLLATADPLALQIQHICEHDLPIAEIAAVVAVVDADHAHDQAGTRPETCWPTRGEIDEAYVTLSKVGPPDASVTALRTQFDQRCGFAK